MFGAIGAILFMIVGYANNGKDNRIKKLLRKIDSRFDIIYEWIEERTFVDVIKYYLERFLIIINGKKITNNYKRILLISFILVLPWLILSIVATSYIYSGKKLVEDEVEKFSYSSDKVYITDLIDNNVLVDFYQHLEGNIEATKKLSYLEIIHEEEPVLLFKTYLKGTFAQETMYELLKSVDSAMLDRFIESYVELSGVFFYFVVLFFIITYFIFYSISFFSILITSSLCNRMILASRWRVAWYMIIDVFVIALMSLLIILISVLLMTIFAEYVGASINNIFNYILGTLSHNNSIGGFGTIFLFLMKSDYTSGLGPIFEFISSFKSNWLDGLDYILSLIKEVLYNTLIHPFVSIYSFFGNNNDISIKQAFLNWVAFLTYIPTFSYALLLSVSILLMAAEKTRGLILKLIDYIDDIRDDQANDNINSITGNNTFFTSYTTHLASILLVIEFIRLIFD